MDEPPADDFPPTESEGWAVAAIPDAAPAPAPQKPEAKAVAPTASSEPARYGESVVRELLGASFIEEQTVAPRVVPRAED